jgi:dTDP-4-dehydrorhamnose 3,5-epimerase
MRVIPTAIGGVMIIEPVVHADARGHFLETFHARQYAEAGLPVEFVQDNESLSTQHVLRGLHLQRRRPQGKLIRVVRGEIWDVAVDVRPESPTFGQWVGETLSDTNYRQLYVPPGCAHGFCVMTELAVVHYKCTTFYDREDEVGIAYDDPVLAIRWPITHPVLSPKDQRNMRWDDFVALLASTRNPDGARPSRAERFQSG